MAAAHHFFYSRQYCRFWRLDLWPSAQNSFQGITFRNKTIGPQFARMPRYFFHLDGDIPARDVIGHDCDNDEQARKDGDFIAHRLGTEKPDMVRDGNLVSVTNEDGDRLFQIPLASTTV